jgi:hypothetical protein
MIETSDQTEQTATGQSAFAAWRAGIDRLAAEANRVVSEWHPGWPTRRS